MASLSIPPALRSLFDEPGPAALGPGPRPTGLPSKRIHEVVARETGGAAGQDLVLALLLLWNDHHEEAHSLVQDLGSADASLIHAMLHRREPDFSNARYWLNRVGRHPIYAPLGQRAAALASVEALQGVEPPLIVRGAWDPYAFAAACEAVEGRAGNDPAVRALQALQALETEVLLERLAGGAAALGLREGTKTADDADSADERGSEAG